MEHRLKTVRKWLIMTCLTLLSMSLYAYARGEPSEYEVKAAFIFNFAKFVEWPETALPANETLNICFVGKDKTTDALQLMHQREAQGHALKIVDVTDELDIALNHQCHILFMSMREKKRQQQWLAKVQHQATLTIADNLDFIKQGGMIGLYTEAQRVQFVVNQSVTQNTGLKLSARMLQLARVPRE